MIQRGFVILIILSLIGIVLKEPFLITLSAALLVVLGIARWWQERSLKNVSYERKFHFTRGFPDEQIELQVTAENRKLLPLSWLRVQDEWEKAVGPVDEDILAPSHIPERGFLTNIFSLRWYEKARRTY
ncbi:MAG TPA: hypothetical protein VLD65_01290, partial [Anaerolineales bacterium]|nr:hypothetical protein [Anaerolineales bacterium]